MTYTEPIQLQAASTRRSAIEKRLRTLRAQASFYRPRLWISYVVERDLRKPLIGAEPTPEVELTIISDVNHPDFNALARISRQMGVSRQRCAGNFAVGAVAAIAHVHRGSSRHPAAMGWITLADTAVPFLNARFIGAGKACLLFQDFVLPQFRGLGLQRMLGRHRLLYAVDHGALDAYGYIRRANTPSLRNAIGFEPVAIVHNLRCGLRAIAHVRGLGHRKCNTLPFADWPNRQTFIIPPR